LRDRVSAQTKLIAVCHPNNPTGYILTETEMDDIVSIADRMGAWILSDEVYRGAEREKDQETPSFFGRLNICFVPVLALRWRNGFGAHPDESYDLVHGSHPEAGIILIQKRRLS